MPPRAHAVRSLPVVSPRCRRRSRGTATGRDTDRKSAGWTRRTPCACLPSLDPGPGAGVRRGVETLALGAVEHFASDAPRRHGRRPAGVERQVRDRLADLIAGDAVAERALEVAGELVAASQREQRRDGDEAAVALAEAGPFPDVAVEDFFAQLDQLRRDGA